MIKQRKSRKKKKTTDKNWKSIFNVHESHTSKHPELNKLLWTIFRAGLKKKILFQLSEVQEVFFIGIIM